MVDCWSVVHADWVLADWVASASALSPAKGPFRYGLLVSRVVHRPWLVQQKPSDVADHQLSGPRPGYDPPMLSHFPHKFACLCCRLLM
jgi:hypothetical protein